MPPKHDANAWRDTELLDPPRPSESAQPPSPSRQSSRQRDPSAARRARAGKKPDPAPRGARRSRSRPSRRSLERRARRRRRAWAAGAVLGLIALLAVGGLYQIVGRAPGPGSADASAWSERSGGPGRETAMPAAAADTAAASPTAAGQGAASATGTWQATGSTTPTTLTGAPAPVGPAPVPAMPDATATGNSPRVTAAGRPSTTQSVLPFMPGSQVVESDNEPQAAVGGGSTWAATLTMQGSLDPVVAYYRQQLTRGASGQAAGGALTEVNPGPGQVLMSVGNPADGSHSAVWIGTVDGQVLIRLMRTMAQSPTP